MKKGTVLVVDDDKELRKIVCLVLEDEGYTVLEAADADTLNRALLQAPDLVLIDLHLPEETGCTLSQWVRRNPATAQIPIIMLTAAGSVPEGWSGDGWLAKPFEIDALYQLVEHWLPNSA